jgi:hypothetical protein
MRCRWATKVTANVVLLSALVACGNGMADPGSPSGESPTDATSEPVSAAFAGRTKFPSCGPVTLDQGQEVPDKAWACLDEAFDTGAELQVTSPTIEGDPILRYYRVGPGIDGLEWFDDLSLDRFGPGGWSHVTCPGTVTVTDPLNCRDVLHGDT